MARVLVLGVLDEQVDDVGHVGAAAPARPAPSARVDASRPTAVSGEQLGADALVDVAVEVEGDRRRGRRGRRRWGGVR